MNTILSKPNYTLEDLARWKSFEGYSDNFYLDGAGYVTIGIGCVIPEAGAASRLNLINKSNTIIALNQEKIDEFNRFRKELPGKVLEYYKSKSTLYLPESSILRLFDTKLGILVDNLRKSIPEYANLPDNAQEVLKDMAFNVGVSGLLTKFPKFVDLIRNHKFQSASNECERKGIQTARNDWTQKTLFVLGD